MSNAAWERLDARLRAAIGGAADRIADSVETQWHGRTLGNYRIEARIAVGGMGVVFRARRFDAEFERLVAIKLLSNPLVSEDARRRFLSERQILADLNHPNIALLLDGGTTPEGVPYLVMEYIEGLPLDEYCTRKELPVAARLKLFVRVCDAVQFAHQHLIVHRDIKPSNVLVTVDGIPKLLDFGIAKLLDGAAHRIAANLTVADARVLTPRNASPEQVRGTTITTASDVYSLGVLLYELLAGKPPYELSQVTATALERAICDRNPELPSRVNRELAREVDAIVMTALRKEPERRYGTARELAEDIERFLEHRPLVARRDSWMYHTRKFVRRHALAVSAVGVALLLIGGLITFYTLRLAHESQRLARESATAEEVSAFLVGLFEEADASQSRPDIQARQVLDDGAARIEQLRDKQPLVASRLMISMGRAHAGLGLYERARQLHEGALALRRARLPDGDPAIAEALHYLGVTQTELREHEVALTTLQDALQRREAAYGAGALPVGETLYRIGVVQHRRGDYAAMGETLRRAVPIYESALGADAAGTADPLRMLGVHYYLVAKHRESDAMLGRALDISERAHGPDSIRSAATLHALGRLRWQTGNFDEAIVIYTRALAIKESHLGLEHPDLGPTLYGLAVTSRDRGALSDARAYYDRVIALQTNVLGPDDFFLALSYSGDGFLKLELGQLQAARASFLRSLEIAEKKWGPNHPDLRAPLAGLAKTLIELGDFDAALVRLERARAIVEPQFPPEHVDVMRTLSSIATLHRRRGDFARARPMFEDVLARFERSMGTGHPFATESLLGMAEVLKAAGDLDRSEEFYGRALGNLAGPYADRRDATADCLEGYAGLLKLRGRRAEADAAAKRAASIRDFLRAESEKTSVLGAQRM